MAPPSARQNGFTLIELSVVMFVLAIVAGFAIPRFRDITGAELLSTARRLSSTTRYLAEESAFRSTIYALNVDLESQSYWVSRFDPATGQFREDDSILSRRVSLSPDVRIVDVVLPTLGKLSEGIAPTYFYPEGWTDPSVIHIVDHRENAYTIRIDPVRGWGEVLDGYQDFEILS